MDLGAASHNNGEFFAWLGLVLARDEPAGTAMIAVQLLPTGTARAPELQPQHHLAQHLNGKGAALNVHAGHTHLQLCCAHHGSSVDTTVRAVAKVYHSSSAHIPRIRHHQPSIDRVATLCAQFTLVVHSLNHEIGLHTNVCLRQPRPLRCAVATTGGLACNAAEGCRVLQKSRLGVDEVEPGTLCGLQHERLLLHPPQVGDQLLPRVQRASRVSGAALDGLTSECAACLHALERGLQPLALLDKPLRLRIRQRTALRLQLSLALPYCSDNSVTALVYVGAHHPLTLLQRRLYIVQLPDRRRDGPDSLLHLLERLDLSQQPIMLHSLLRIGQRTICGRYLSNIAGRKLYSCSLCSTTMPAPRGMSNELRPI